jgi:hypothetical protein
VAWARRAEQPAPTSAATFRRRRLVAVAVLVAATTVMVGLVLRGPLRGPGDGPLVTGSTGDLVMRPAAAHIHIVQPGETVWSIVESSGVRGDPRPMVDRLESEVNHRPLQVGERLVLP